MKKIILVFSSVFLLSACDFVDTITGEASRQENIKMSKAVGAACRQSGRNIEDCFNSNPKALKASIFDGWKEMDQYMRENQLEIQESKLNSTDETLLPKGQNNKKSEAAMKAEKKLATKEEATVAEKEKK